jgi:hypothetical protein
VIHVGDLQVVVAPQGVSRRKSPLWTGRGWDVPRFVGNVRILLGHLSSPDENYTSFVEFIRAKVSAELAGRSEHGENLSVFSYQFTDQDGFGLRLIRLRFYQNVEVYVSMQPADVEIPTNMAMLLVERGVPTTIHDGGVDYRFNTRPVR